jgi:hypothetical protein
MAYFDMNQQSGLQNPTGWINPQIAQMYGQNGRGFGVDGLGLGAYGQQYANFGNPFGQYGVGASGPGQGIGWGGQQRQLTQQDVGEVVRQLVPLLPHIVAQAQQPLAAFGYGGYGSFGYGPYQQRLLTQQDVNEVVRQILPILPQIVGALQGQMPLHAAAMYGGVGQGLGGQGWAGQGPYGQLWGGQNPYPQGQTFINQQPLGQPGWQGWQAAFGGSPHGAVMQRQLSPQDVNEVVRQLVWTIPQVIGNLQAHGQQRAI